MLRDHGALFVNDICQLTGRMPGEVAEALWDGMARGLLTADGFQSRRALLSADTVASVYGQLRRKPIVPSRRRRVPTRTSRPGRSRSRLRPALSGGRLVPSGGRTGRGRSIPTSSPRRSQVKLLLALGSRLSRPLRARAVCPCLARRALGAAPPRGAGVVLGARYVAGFSGEQFALPEAAEQLRAAARRPADGVSVRLSAADPLNLTGVILPGPRIPAQRAKTIVLIDGVVERPEEAAPETDTVSG